MSFMKLTASAVAIAAVSASAAAARDQIRIVGSSTVFPFSTAVAEQFGKTTDFQTPVVESTGSGGGLKLFCAGVGTQHPDISNASRRMKQKEFAMCQENGVENVTEAVVGYDGIVVANAKEGAEYALTRTQLWEALAMEGPKPTTWDEVDPALPQVEIEVLGPPPTSGTRDAFEEAGGEDCGGAGMEIREDGVYIDAGENDNLIVSKLEANPDALGIFGFSFLDQNRDAIQGATIDGTEPTFEKIASGEYPVSRSLFFYIKNAHVGVVPGVHEYALEFVSEDAIGPNGYTVEKGLIPLPEDMFEEVRDRVENLTPMTGDEWN
jgi:phosphate transport system substrate-binding protein